MSGCVLDTDVAIAALDRSDAHHADAAEGIEAMIARGAPLLLSLINYAETLVRPASDERSLHAAMDALATLGIWLVVPTPAVAVDAARHRALNMPSPHYQHQADARGETSLAGCWSVSKVCKQCWLQK